MYQSPRMRRLRNDILALERLRSESSIFRFTPQGDPPHVYRIHFQGRGLWRDHGKVRPIEKHHVEVKLGASYPRTIPEIRWLTPIYHPNISEIGMVCLGGYGTHWVPSVQLDELCTMLWDMLRYHNYDIRSPYNRDAALWVAQQQSIRFPTDARPLRDLRVALGRVVGAVAESAVPESSAKAGANRSDRSGSRSESGSATTGRMGRVRNFAQRYGRIFGAAEQPAPPLPPQLPPLPPPDAASPAVPANSELLDLVTAQAAAAGPVDPLAGDEPVFILDPDPEPAAARPAGDERVDVAAEVRRLVAGRQPAAPPADEIVFIE